MRMVTGLLTSIAILLGSAGGVYAQSYPARPIRLIAPFPPGGGTDLTARLIAQKLTLSMGQQVIVDNRPGANGSIGIELAARARPDGYTLALGNNGPLAINVSLSKKLPYDPVKDLAAVSLIASYPYIVVVRPSLPVKSMKELVDFAKTNPGKLNFASSGSVTGLAGAMLKSAAGINMIDVPYNGNGPAVTALLGGHVDLMLASVPMAEFKLGTLRALAVTGAKRSLALPELPTVEESGIPGFDATAWYGIVVPAATPQDIILQLNTKIIELLKLAEVRERLRRSGVEIVGSSPAEFGALIKAEVAKWAKVVRDSGLTRN